MLCANQALDTGPQRVTLHCNSAVQNSVDYWNHWSSSYSAGLLFFLPMYSTSRWINNLWIWMYKLEWERIKPLNVYDSTRNICWQFQFASQTTARITRYSPPVFKTRRFKPDKLIRKHHVSLLVFSGQDFIKQPTATSHQASLAVSQSQWRYSATTVIIPQYY